jgi:tetratricopeptide (TPR) repeat protein
MDHAHLRTLIASGRYSEAQALCEQACLENPGNPEPWFLRSEMHLRRGELEPALRSCREVLARSPAHAGARYNLALALQGLGRAEEAVIAYREVLARDDAHAGAHAALAGLYGQRGMLEPAMTHARRALALRPDLPQPHNILGLLHKARGELDLAVGCLEQAVRIQPAFVEAWFNLGLCRNQQQRYDEARDCFEKALNLRPALPEAENGRGNALKGLGQFEAAGECYRRALALRPGFIEARNNLGVVLTDLDRLEEAETVLLDAVKMRPDFMSLYSNLGITRLLLGKPGEALACYEQALRLNPGSAEVHWNRSWPLLLTGDLEQGWREYEWRERCGVVEPRKYPQPLWDGSTLHGKTILVYGEQGLGDIIQFARYMALLKRAGAKVIFECPRALARLFAMGRDIDELIIAGDPLPSFDMHVSLLSLPGLFGTRLDTIPAEVPYVSVPPVMRSDLEQVLNRHRNRFNIGIVWSGNPTFRWNRRRSCSLDDFAVLAQCAGVTLFSLQKGDAAAALDGRANDQIIGLQDYIGDFADTAAAMMQLDLVITVDTSVAHLAGALGRPVWVLLPLAPDWRWLLGRNDNPWYPTMRLFRQTRRGDWSGVFARVAAELKNISRTDPAR